MNGATVPHALEFSREMQTAYSTVLADWCREHQCEYILQEGRPPRPDEPFSPDNLARELFWHFPAHFFKVQGLLTKRFGGEDVVWHNEITDRGPVEKCEISVVDIGCGLGTATLALADLALRRNATLISRSLAPAVTVIKVVGVEPSHEKNELFRRLINAYNGEAQRCLVEVRLLDVVGKPFPDKECVRACHDLLQIPIHALMIVASNLMYWIAPRQHWWHRARSLIADKFSRLRRNPSEEESWFITYVKAVRELIEKAQPDVFYVVGVETRKEELGQIAWHVGRTLAEHFDEHPSLYENSNVAYRNPYDSARRRQQRDYVNRYHGFCVSSWRQLFDREPAWQHALSRRSLTLAWAKVRHAMHLDLCINNGTSRVSV